MIDRASKIQSLKTQILNLLTEADLTVNEANCVIRCVQEELGELKICRKSPRQAPEPTDKP